MFLRKNKMGYLHIDNLYKNQEILMFKECYALEKIHGCSSHIAWKDNQLHFFSGGAKEILFLELFDQSFLTKKFEEYAYDEMVIFGEAYGGKMQGMKGTYGDKLKFVAFDVKIGHSWLNVPDMDKVAKEFGLDVVDWVKVSTDLNVLDRERDRFSVQAAKNGCGEDKLREGIVLRPLIELKKNNSARILSKHKNDKFKETKTPRYVSEEDLVVLTKANEIADEWVTEMRLDHVLDKMGPDIGIEKTKYVIAAMLEDIEREAIDEIVMSKEAKKAISRKTGKMFTSRIKKSLYEEE